ncbi:MAG: 2-oxoacid:acceptor oxidoreductase family protein [Candidatus Nanoarchaeia archaeon]|nr:2-oxoacid:acceptor oxidoreductase family protein [Candidatus Nanoarchaeia archaeon]
MAKLIITGTGGQGIKFMGNVLAEYLMLKGFNVSAFYDYDAAMRGGGIQGYLTFSKEKIINPLIDSADFLVVLDNSKYEFNAKKTIADSSLNIKEGDIKAPFRETAEKMFSNKTMLNMVALGYLIKLLGIGMDEKMISGILPQKFIKENIAAIKAGFELKI